MKYLFLSILSLFVTSHLWAGDYQSLYQNLPVALVEPTAPVIPDTRVSIIDFGGVGDGITNNTEAFKKAISALSKKGGGHLDVPAGIYVVGLISLKDNIDLHLERNAMIMASPEKKDFLPADKDGAKAVPCISASKRHNISITGEGTIDGNGEWWRAVKRGKVSDEEWKAFQEMGGTVTADGKLWYPFDLKHFGNVADSYESQETMRTHLIRFTDCENVLVKGVTIQNAPKFHLVPQRCKHVIIDDVTVRCPWNAQNGDGIDLMQCQEVLVTRCKVDVGDDGDAVGRVLSQLTFNIEGANAVNIIAKEIESERHLVGKRKNIDYASANRVLARLVDEIDALETVIVQQLNQKIVR